MRIFKITENIEIVCESEKTRSGFRHLATLVITGAEQEKAKVCYQNRTWERYEFETVMQKLVNSSKVLSEPEKKVCLAFIDGDHTDWSGFNTVEFVAKLGEIFCDNQKDKNDWKARMLKAGLENKGLVMPEDWDTLDEDTKQARLDAVIKVMGENK